MDPPLFRGGSNRGGHASFIRRCADGKVAEGDRIVVAGKIKVAFGQAEAGVLLLAHDRGEIDLGMMKSLFALLLQLARAVSSRGALKS